MLLLLDPSLTTRTSHKLLISVKFVHRSAKIWVVQQINVILWYSWQKKSSSSNTSSGNNQNSSNGGGGSNSLQQAFVVVQANYLVTTSDPNVASIMLLDSGVTSHITKDIHLLEIFKVSIIGLIRW